MADVLFRDGKKSVPDHLAQLMSGLETYKMTYDDAVAQVNQKLVTDHLDKTFDKIVSQHFENWRRR